MPLVSFLLLGGRCRHCGEKISLRYFFVELLTAVSGTVLLFYSSDYAGFLIYWFFTCILIVVAFIDIERRLIPDIFSIPGIFAGLVLSAFFSTGSAVFSAAALKDSLIGVLAGGGSMYLMGVLGEMAFKEKAKKAGGAVGGGDVKLMAMIGAFMGWKLALVTFFLAPVLGAAAGLYVLLKRKQDIIPYGPFLALGAFISLLYGDNILSFLFGF